MRGMDRDFKNLGEEGADLLLCLLQMNPENRIRIEDVYRHPFFADLTS